MHPLVVTLYSLAGVLLLTLLPRRDRDIACFRWSFRYSVCFVSASAGAFTPCCCGIPVQVDVPWIPTPISTTTCVDGISMWLVD